MLSKNKCVLWFVLIGSFVLGDACAQTSPSAYTTGYRYDIAQRLVGVIRPDPDGAGPLKHLATRNTYDNSGNLISVESGELASWQSEAVAPSNWAGFSISTKVVYSYDDWGRRTGEATYDGATIERDIDISYDAQGRIDCSVVRMNKSIFSPIGHNPSLGMDACVPRAAGTYGPDRITKYSYDDYDRVTKVQKAVATAIAQDYAVYTYTGNGLRQSVKDANGNYSSMAFDGHDRQTHWYFPSKTIAGQANLSDYEQYTYDENGNVKTLRKRDGTVLYYVYDKLDREILESLPGTSSDVYSGYNLQGLKLYARFASHSGLGITNTYDGFGRLKSQSNNMGGTTRTINYLFDSNGNKIRLTHPDGIYFAYEFDGLDRVTRIRENSTSSSTLVTFSYDNQGQRSQIIRTGGANTIFHYDGLSRLKDLDHDFSGTNDDVSYDFGYNPANQIVSKTVSNSNFVFSQHNTGSQSYSVNGLNQYTTIEGGTLGYDSNGNLTSRAGTTYTYDKKNRLLTASGTNNANITYDPLGRIFEISGASVERFLFDGDSLIGVFNNVGSTLNRYVHTDRTDEPIVGYSGSGVYTSARSFFHSDHAGSVVARSNSSSALTSQNLYDSYGVPDSSNQGRFGYTGQLFISELKLNSYKARFYDPEIGRFMQTDPIGYEDHNNLYAYAANDPINRVDPNGKASLALVSPKAVVACAGPQAIICAKVAVGAAVVGGLAYAGYKLGESIAAKNEDDGEPTTEGTRELGELEPIHDADHPQNDTGIADLSDEELGEAINNPKEGDKVKVRGNKVLDGNTRVNEAKGRGWADDTEIPVIELPEVTVDPDDPLGPYRDY